ncbi:MAG TPA: hypothetical protein VK550_03450 [Polyangiaceae bacterium]|jgi:hypothetical protein|nr:hypothetical protein [Polyangiaceae bacterium]
MSFKRLAVLPLLAGLVPALIVLSIEVARTRQIALRVEIETVKILGLTGSVIAALSFDRGEHLRRAWLLNGSCYGVLLLRDLLYGVWLVRDSGELSQYLEAGMVLVANAGAVTGVWMLSRTWKVAGIALPWSPLRREIVRWVGIVVGFAIAGPSLWFSIEHAMQGQVRAIVSAVSSAGDILTLALIVPVLLTTLALRGGLLSWPWGLMTASQFGWLIYDATGTIRLFMHVEPVTATMWSEIFRALACMYCFAAGIAQRAVSAPDAAAAPVAVPKPA